MLMYSEGQNKLGESDAHTAMEILSMAYPGYGWATYMTGGVLQIKCLDLDRSYGMVVKFADLAHDAAVFKRKVIYYGGELLERCGLKRGLANGDEITHVDGLPEHKQPGYVAPDQKVQLVLPEGYNPDTPVIRDKVMPQVAKLLQ